MGTFLTLEGLDGCGKSTQAVLLSRWLEDYTGRESVRTYEPGGWNGGDKLREILLHTTLAAKSELFLFMSDRSEHVKRIIMPALKADKNVLCERYCDSSIAYQSGGHGLKFEYVVKIMKAGHFVEPDMTIYYDIDPERALNRLRERRGHDRFEDSGLAFLKRVSNTYRRLAKLNSERIKLIKVDDLNIMQVYEQTIEIIKNSCVLFK